MPSLGNEVWALDFVSDRTCDGKSLKILTVLDEHTREALAVKVERKMGAADVRGVLLGLFMERGIPAFVRSDNGSEFAGHLLEEAMSAVGSEVALIAPGSPWQNGKNERFNGILVEEVLSREVWGSLLEAQVVCEQWRETYNQVRPHGSLGMMTPHQYALHEKQRGCWFQQVKLGRLTFSLDLLFGAGLGEPKSSLTAHRAPIPYPYASFLRPVVHRPACGA